MHASLLHGSAPNLSNHARTLYITTYYAEDAIELSPNHLPSRFTHELVRGVATEKVRCSPYEMSLPAKPTGTSFLRSKRAPGKMKLKLHHINLSTNNVSGMDYFYRNVLGLKAETDGLPVLENKGYDGNVAFVSDGHIQTHLAQKDLNINFRTGHTINPLERGHIAYRTDDLDAFKAHLEEKGIPFSDWGETAVAGWQQIFFYDPDGNIIEVHQLTT